MGCGPSKDSSEQQPTRDITDKPEDRRSVASSQCSDATFGYHENMALFAHNHFREMHQVAPVKLSRDLCELACSLAERMARSEQLDQSPAEDRLHEGQPCGENLYWKSDPSIPANGDEAVKSWYAEGEHYDYNGKFIPEAAHFTQLVWAASKQIGVGSASSANGTAVVVVYFPSGNIDGQFTDNVKPMLKPAST